MRWSRWVSGLGGFAAALLLVVGAVPTRAQDKPESDPPAQSQTDGKQPQEEKKPQEEPKPDEPKADEPREGRRGERNRRRPLDERNERSHASVRSAFRDVVGQAVKSTASILAGGKQIALGAVVDPHGYILTKASELGDSELSCRLADGHTHTARLVGIDPETDLAMLKIDADNLVAVDWREDEAPAVGSWLVTTGIEALPAAVGVLSVEPRQIAQTGGMLGVKIDQQEGKPRVDQVLPNSGAEKAGVHVNDVITHLNGKPLGSAQALFNSLARLKSGQTVKL
jgi:S1-C subfamily serine protease